VPRPSALTVRHAGAAALALLAACARPGATSGSPTAGPPPAGEAPADSAGAAGAAGSGGAERAGLVGTDWLLEDLAGRAVLADVRATLAFPADGQVAGVASCNRFTGTVSVRGDSVAFGPLATTRMGCAPAVADQETRYLAALRDAHRLRRDGPSLFLEVRGAAAPLRFTRRGGG
jgi:heat shock protein HslJ